MSITITAILLAATQLLPYLIAIGVALYALSRAKQLRSRGSLIIGLTLFFLGRFVESSTTAAMSFDIFDSYITGIALKQAFYPITLPSIFFICVFATAHWPYRPDTYLNVKEAFLSFRGCVPRNVFWVTSSLLGFAQFLIMIPLVTLVEPSGAFDGVPDWVLILAFAITLIPAILGIWASLAIYAKRWHDLGKSGWWTLVSLVPIFGPLYCLIMLGFVKGQSEEYPREYHP